MTNFIKNLIQKASGTSLLTKLEPSLMTDFKVFSQASVFPAKKSPDDTLAVKNLPVEYSQDFPAIFDEIFDASKSTPEEFSSTSGIKYRCSSKETSEKTLKKESVDIAGIPIQPENPKLDKYTVSPVVLSQTNYEGESSLAKDISLATEPHNTSLGNFKKPTPDRLLRHSKASTSGSGLKKQFEPSISAAPEIGAQHHVSNKFPKSQSESSVIENGFRSYPSAFEGFEAKGKPPLALKHEIHIFDTEPVVETQQQTFINDLIKKTKSASLPFSAERKDVKTTPVQAPKEVRVNIGKIEIKASPQFSRTAKPTPSGFEDKIMMRLYLDRHYF